MIEDELKRIADALERLADMKNPNQEFHIDPGALQYLTADETGKVTRVDLKGIPVDTSALKNVVASYGTGIPIEPSAPAKPVDRLRAMAQRAKK